MTELHLKHVEEYFNTLQEYNMKLNLKKCTFALEAGKFLGFLVSHKGIEANPRKFKAIM